MRRIILGVVCVVLMSGAVRLAAQETFERPSPRYQIRNGDVINLVFPFSAEFNQTVAVQPDGFITLKVLGDLQGAGKTVPELTGLLREKYSSILRDPIITVELKEFEAPFFVAGGQVSRPGKYDLRGDITLTEAIAIAGGFNKDAKHSQVLIFRRSSDEWAEVKTIDAKKMLKGANLTDDIRLRSGDMVYVPEKTMAKIKPFLPMAAVRLFFEPF